MPQICWNLSKKGGKHLKKKPYMQNKRQVAPCPGQVLQTSFVQVAAKLSGSLLAPFTGEFGTLAL